MEKEAENPITTELVKNNVTDTVLKNIKIKYLPLKINGIDDKEGYDTVHKARIVCRDLRVLTEKLCKKGREDATKIQKAWIQKEKEVVAEISEVEQHLKKQEDAVDAEKEAIKIRQERLLKLPGRKEQIVGVESYFAIELNDNVIMSFDDPTWNNLVLMAKQEKIEEFEEKERVRKNQERQSRLIERTNTLYKAGVISVLRFGVKNFQKGNVCIPEIDVADMTNELWESKYNEIANAQGETPVPVIKNAVDADIFYKPGVTARISPIPQPKDLSDDEKLFNYASALEKVEWPGLKTKEATEIFNKAQEKLNEAINILRQ